MRSKIVDHFRRRQRQAAGEGGTDAQMQLAAVADPLSTETEDEAAAESALVAQRALQLIKPEFSAAELDGVRAGRPSRQERRGSRRAAEL